MQKTAILLLNLGTPDEPTPKAVRRYMTQFFDDKNVIDLPKIGRRILTRCCIIPFRVPKSTKLYQTLWTENGSPLAYNTSGLNSKLQSKMPDNVSVFHAMRYQNPSVKKVMNDIYAGGYDKLLVLPLYPQYATSSTFSVMEAVENEMREWTVRPEIVFVKQFYNHSAFIEAFSRRISSYNIKEYDYVLFSYHGLPNRHIRKIHLHGSLNDCEQNKCEAKPGHYCYKASCYETTRLLAERLGLEKKQYATSFQSHLSSGWFTPITNDTLIELANKGYKRVLVTAPSFVSDCLETIVEIDIVCKEKFLKHGGEKLTLVESLNMSDEWVSALEEIIRDNTLSSFC